MGKFGEYGKLSEDENPSTRDAFQNLTQAYITLKSSPNFADELAKIGKSCGRPTPLVYAQRLTEHCGGAKIYLKREDMLHGGAHKMNHSLGYCLFAKTLGKSTIVSESAGTHGLCLANAAAVVGIACEIFMGENDYKAQAKAVRCMRVLGTKVTCVSTGNKDLKAAADVALDVFARDPEHIFYAHSTVAGPLPFPEMIKDFQSVVGDEAHSQMLESAHRLPNHVVATVAGGSNALGLFTAFQWEDVKLYAVEPEPSGKDQDTIVNPGQQYIAPYIFGEMEHPTIPEREAAAAFFVLARTEGIVAAMESCYAVAYAMKLAVELPKEEIILVNLSGRGDWDIDKVADKYGTELGGL
eukprot:TRINITY_DN1366_c0_g1_i1.p1 TRINITY_DN1366_c0_g1~~TRINITY_DN1366_c0_g1_i1.p1  ORF type:complete len:381 (-),score=47.78 TRINITY_DN1366_c0_g1_i1:24-1085(-)